MPPKGYKHGHGPTKNGPPSSTYKIWQNIKQRCLNPNNWAYPRYGARGIGLCDKWLKFEGFLEDMGERPEGLTLERIDNNGSYCKENCKWSDRKTQARNRSSNRSLTINGETRLMVEWAELVGITIKKISCRLSRGWSEEEAVYGRRNLFQYPY